MRNTPYAKELATASVALGGHESRIERIYVKKKRQEEIRFSWWKNGGLMMRPLDLPERQLIELLREAIRENVFSREFQIEARNLFKK